MNGGSLSVGSPGVGSAVLAEVINVRADSKRRLGTVARGLETTEHVVAGAAFLPDIQIR